MASKLYSEFIRKIMFGEFNETDKRKTSLAKYPAKFNDFAGPQRPNGRPLLRLLGRPYKLLYVERFASRLE